MQMEIPEESVYYALQRGKMLGKITILNPAPAPDKIPDEIYEGLTYLTPNETELAKLTGMPTDQIEEVEKAAKCLLEKGVKHVLVTLGERGAMLCGRGITKHFPASKVRAVDTTAAGDTFHGAFAVKLMEGASMEEAITFANAAAALSVSRQGAQTSVPTRQEVENYMTKGEET